MDDAQRVVDAHAASDRQVFVDMAGRFDPATEVLATAIAAGSYGPLRMVQFSVRTARLWEGYELGLESIAMDVLHGTFDTVASALGRPERTTALGVAGDAGGSAAEVLLTYPNTLVGCSASALMPRPYGVRGGYLATFGDAVLESSWTAGWDGRPTGTLTEYTDSGARERARQLIRRRHRPRPRLPGRSSHALPVSSTASNSLSTSAPSSRANRDRLRRPRDLSQLWQPWSLSATCS